MQDTNSNPPILTPLPSPQVTAEFKPIPQKGLLSHPWIRAIILSTLVYSLVFAYEYTYFQGQLTVILSESLSASGGVLIGISFVLSSLSYFFNLFDKELHYRKQYGLMGFFLALAYSSSLLFRFPERYIANFLSELFKPDVVLGLVAMSIFGFMAVISHPLGMKKLGRWWRPCLRLGYVAYALLIVRAEIVEHQIWASWLDSMIGLPPPRMLLSIFALSILFLRVEMQVIMMVKRRTLTRGTP